MAKEIEMIFYHFYKQSRRSTHTDDRRYLSDDGLHYGTRVGVEEYCNI
jgi:hypothetical protein